MNSLMRASFRAQRPRLKGTATAIALAVAFLSVALNLSVGMYTSMRDGLTASMARADVRVEFDDDAVVTDASALMRSYQELARQVEGVISFDLEQSIYPQLSVAGKRTPGLISVLLDPAVRWQELEVGSWPRGDDQVVVGRSTADALGLAVGDLVTVAGAGAPITLTVAGVWSTGSTGLATGTPALIATEQAVARTGSDPVTTALLLVGDGTAADTLADRVSAILPSEAPVLALTRDEAMARGVAQLTGGVAVLALIVVAFIGVTLFAAGLVITNTFSVMVARRTQELALLRCVGAAQSQVRHLILGEAALIGSLAAVTGACLGWAAANGLAAIGQSWGLAMAPSGLAVLIGVFAVAVGIVLTLLAAAGPARRANRVAPLVALRGTEASATPSVLRRLIGVVSLAGAGLCLLGVWNGAGLPLALIAGVLAYVVVAAGAPDLYSALTRMVGRLWRHRAPAARIGVLNLDRNPLRTGATAVTVVVGVALVVLMSVGLSSVRGSLLAQIDAERPIDLVVESSAPTGIDDRVQEEVAAIPGVDAVAAVRVGAVTVPEFGAATSTLRAVEPASSARVARDGRSVPPAGEVWVSSTDHGELADGDQITVVGDRGSRALIVRVTDTTNAGVLSVAPVELGRLVADPVVGLLQLRMSDDPDSVEAQQVVATVLGLSADLTVYGGVQDRVYYTSVLNRMLAVVLALLAVTILVGFVGIANTTSMAVLERRGEYAMLRAAGMTRAQLIRMVCVEAGVIASAASAIGAVLGVALAWAGLCGLRASATRLILALQVPVTQVVLVVVVAMLCGAVASIGPALAASRRTIVQDMVLVG